MPPRKCSRENCSTQNTSRDLTVICRRCRCQIHLLCYGIDGNPKDIFVTSNIVMLCDERVTGDFEQSSPKWKSNAANFVQRTLDANMSLSTTPVAESPSNKNVTAKPTTQTTQKLIESLSLEIKTQTATIAALKSSVDLMHGTITQQEETVGKSIGMNNENISSIKTPLSKTQNFIESIKKQSYANVTKGSVDKRKRNEVETPKSSRPLRFSDTNKNKTPAVSGTSNNVIGKPLTPTQHRPKMKRKIPEKAVWISRLHRDTSVEDISSYVTDKLGIEAVDQLEIRKLVKKDRDISEYSFVSFRIACPAELFDTLMDVSNWPSYCQIREFKLELNPSHASAGIRIIGTSLTANTPSNTQPPSNNNESKSNSSLSKNEDTPRHETMETETL